MCWWTHLLAFFTQQYHTDYRCPQELLITAGLSYAPCLLLWSAPSFTSALLQQCPSLPNRASLGTEVPGFPLRIMLQDFFSRRANVWSFSPFIFMFHIHLLIPQVHVSLEGFCFLRAHVGVHSRAISCLQSSAVSFHQWLEQEQLQFRVPGIPRMQFSLPFSHHSLWSEVDDEYTRPVHVRLCASLDVNGPVSS